VWWQDEAWEVGDRVLGDATHRGRSGGGARAPVGELSTLDLARTTVDHMHTEREAGRLVGAQGKDQGSRWSAISVAPNPSCNTVHLSYPCCVAPYTKQAAPNGRVTKDCSIVGVRLIAF
jgi:hypothetical protein